MVVEREICGMLMSQTSSHMTHASSPTQQQQQQQQQRNKSWNKHMTGPCAALGYISTLQMAASYPRLVPLSTCTSVSSIVTRYITILY